MNSVDRKWPVSLAPLLHTPAAASAHAERVPEEPHSAVTPPGRVLLVEDDAAIRNLVVEILTDEGYDVVAAPDAATALTLVHPPCHWRPDLLLLDVYLPGMDGTAFARAYQRLPVRHAPIVLLTSASATAAAGHAEEIGATGFLLKPFDLDALVATVRQYAAESRRTRAP
jgi:CheY-like chemotaxis protein